MAIEMRDIKSDTKIDEIFNRDFSTVLRPSYVEVGKDNICLPIYYRDLAKDISKFNVLEDDVIIAGHPKTGTTWAQEMIWLIINNLDYKSAFERVIYRRFPQLELTTLFNFQLIDHSDQSFFLNVLKFMEEAKGRRCWKTHLPWYLLPEQIQNGAKTPKIIVTLRGPEDTCVSLFYHSKTFEGNKGSFDDFCKLFLAGRVTFGPFWKQVLSYWEQRHRQNIIFITYKEMKEDLTKVIKRVAKFLDKNLTDQEVSKLTKHLSFEEMKKNRSVNYENLKELLQNSSHDECFIRSGKVGGYKTIMSQEVIKQFEIWTKDNLNGSDLNVE